MLLLALSTLLAGGLPTGSPVDAQEDVPTFSIDLDTGGLVGSGWVAGADVTVTVGDPDDPTETVEGSVDDGGWIRTNVDADLAPGTLVTVTDGVTVKEHLVAHLELDVDPATAVVSGEAEPGTTVTVSLLRWPDGPGGPETVYNDDVVADPEGAWAVDLGAAGFELDDRHMVFAEVIDADGDSTLLVWSLPSPQIQVYPELDEIRGRGFTSGAEVGITVDEYATTSQSDAFGDFDVVVDHDLQPGQLVTVADGTLTSEHTILPLAIEHIDVETNVVSGVGEPLYWTLVGRLPSRDDHPSHLRSTDAAADGTWTIDFSGEQTDNPLSEPLDIQPGMLMSAGQFDDGGHLTGVFRTATADGTDPDDPGPVVGVCPAPSATPAFPDVSPDNVHVNAIDCAAYHEIALGYADGTYGPADGVRRDQIASFIVRTLEAAGHTLPAPAHTFSDIAGSTHERAIGQLAAADIVLGRTPTEYAPARTVTRDQVASYLVRALDWALDTTHTAPASPFTDIAGNTHEQAIHTAYDLELTTGRTATTYAPRMDVRRDQMATFLVNLLPQAMQAN